MLQLKLAGSCDRYIRQLLAAPRTRHRECGLSLYFNHAALHEGEDWRRLVLARTLTLTAGSKD